jgi:hypothetical protein
MTTAAPPADSLACPSLAINDFACLRSCTTNATSARTSPPMADGCQRGPEQPVGWSQSPHGRAEPMLGVNVVYAKCAAPPVISGRFRLQPDPWPPTLSTSRSLRRFDANSSASFSYGGQKKNIPPNRPNQIRRALLRKGIRAYTFPMCGLSDGGQCGALAYPSLRKTSRRWSAFAPIRTGGTAQRKTTLA